MTAFISGRVEYTAAWLIVTMATSPEPEEKRASFTTLIGKDSSAQMPLKVFAMLIGTITVYSALFATGYYLYGNMQSFLIAAGVFIFGLVLSIYLWRRLKVNVS